MGDFVSFLRTFSTDRLAILLDDAGSERAALIAPAAACTSSEVNRILHLSGGLTFVAVSPERAAAFLLHSMDRPRTLRTAHSGTTHTAPIPQYTSVEARAGVTTGISAADRAATISILGAETPNPRALVKPGHIFPVETREGGVLVKLAIPEGAVDITTLAGFGDAALFVDLLDEHGALMNSAAATMFAEAHRIPITTLTQLIAHRLEREPIITRTAEATIPSTLAEDLRAIVYRSKLHSEEHIALVKGEIPPQQPVLVRVQAENTLTDLFGSPRFNSRRQLHNSLRAINARGCGVLLYLRRVNFTDAPDPSTAATVMREYGVGAQILRDLGVSQIELLTSTPRSLLGLPSFGIEIVAQHPIPEYESQSPPGPEYNHERTV